MGKLLKEVKTLAASGAVVLSQHAYDRLAENAMEAADIESGTAMAIEVEDYPDAFKGPSVLVLQQDRSGLPIHVVWGLRKGSSSLAIVVTAYRPDPDRWSIDFRTRK
jgi:Domain of unknown function (DUF4258)